MKLVNKNISLVWDKICLTRPKAGVILKRKEHNLMPRYKVTINTDSYKLGSCSKKNWEPGTRNDYMLAINGLTRTLNNMREVMWQIELFRGNSFLMSEYDENNKEENKHNYKSYTPAQFISKFFEEVKC
jgi:hypothetical protein